MLPFKTQIAGKFVEQVEARARKWADTKISARITVPDELVWWYWQEFGTAASGDAGRASGHTYEIVPVKAKYLIYPYQGKKVMTLKVEAHPGIKPRRSVTKALPDIRDNTKTTVRQALHQGGADHPELIREAILEATLAAKRRIVASIAENITGTRVGDPDNFISPGRLGGETAASVFDSQAQVVSG